MLKDILFRGKSLEDGTWVKGYVVFDSHHCRARIITPQTKRDDWNWIVTDVDANTIGVSLTGEDGDPSGYFSGDIVKVKFIMCEETWLSWLDENGNFFDEYADEIAGNIHNDSEYVNLNVIGNIYDNEDLYEKIRYGNYRN